MSAVVYRASGARVETLTVDGRDALTGSTRIAITHDVAEPARLSIDYVALDINAELEVESVVSRVYIAGVTGEGPTVRDAVADVLRQMDEQP